METDSVMLDCGCEQIKLENKVMWIYCDEHDEENSFVKFSKTNKMYIKLDD